MLDKIYLNDGLHLPNEILAIVINELASDMEDNRDETLPALASCRLASHALCSLATPRFFSSIQLTDYAGINRPPDCNVLFKRATLLDQILTIRHVATSVHIFTLHCHHIYFQDSGNVTLISSILHHLPHVQEFSFGATGSWLTFSFLPEDLVSAIHTLCRSPTLTRLYLDNILDLSLTVITQCPNLRFLHLWDVSLTANYDFWFDTRDETSSPQLLYLDSLSMNAHSIYSLGTRIAGDKTNRELFSRMKTLQLMDLFRGRTLAVGWDIMLLASQTLTTLDLMSQDEYPDFDYAIRVDLSRFPALRHFKIQRRIPYWSNSNYLYFLTQLFSPSSTSSGIETLEIAITWNDVDIVEEKDLFSCAEWSTLDQLLTSQMFGSLSKVVLHLRLEMEDRISKERDQDLDHILELERNLSLPYVNDLFPQFTALTERTLEKHIEVGKHPGRW